LLHRGFGYLSLSEGQGFSCFGHGRDEVFLQLRQQRLPLFDLGFDGADEVGAVRRVYRRGLATNLHELGVPDKVIQAILRHEDVSTTQRRYIKTVPQVVTDAMNQLEARIARAAVVQQVSVN